MKIESKKSLAEYAEHISIPGSGNIASRSKLKRYSWLITILLAISLLSYQLLLVIQEYKAFRLNTVVKNHGYGFRFPDVTICKVVPFSSEKTSTRDLGISKAIRFWKYAMNWTSDSAVEENTAFTNAYLSFQDHVDERDLLTDILEHIHYCNYNLLPCDPTDFKRSSHPSRANCVTFSPKYRVFVGTEIHRGLNMILSMGKSFMIKYPLHEFAISDGYEVIIHEKGTIFKVDKDSVVIRPWSYVNLFLTMTNYTRFNTPLSKCKTEASIKRMFTRSYFGFLKGRTRCNITKILSDEDCLDFIQTIHLYGLCKCFDDRKPAMCNGNRVHPKCHSLPRHFFYNDRIDPNGTMWYRNQSVYLPNDKLFRKIVKRAKCFDKHAHSLEKIMNVSRISRFPKRCLKTSYSVHSVSYKWPSSKHETIQLLKEKISQVSFTKNKSQLLKIINAENEAFSYLTISPSSLEVKEIEEYLAYSLTKVASDFGGTISLWIGCCFLTVLEVLEFIAKCLVSVRRFCLKENKKNETEQVPTYNLETQENAE